MHEDDIVALAQHEGFEVVREDSLIRIHKTLAERDMARTADKDEYRAEVRIDAEAKTIHFSERLREASKGLLAGDTEFSSGFGFRMHTEKVVGSRRDEHVVQGNTLEGESLSYSFTMGDFRKKVEALAKERGYMFKTHVLPLSVRGGSSSRTASIVFGALRWFVLMLGALLAVGGEVGAGTALIVAAAFLFPRTWDRVQPKLPRMVQRKWVLVGCCVVASVILLGGSDAKATYTKSVVDGGDDPYKVAAVAKDMAELIHAYEVTQIRTAAAFQVAYGSMTIDEYRTMLDEIIVGWQQVDKEAGDLADHQSSLPQEIAVPARTSLLDAVIPHAFAQNPQDMLDELGNPNAEGMVKQGSVYSNFELRQATEQRVAEKMEQEQYDAVTAVKNQLPSAKMLQLVQDHMQVTAQEALRIIHKHEKEIGAAWNNESEYYKRMADGASVLETGSKALLMVGGTVVAGGTVAGATLAKTAFVGATVFVGGVDAALDVQDTALTVYGGDEKMLKYVQQTKQDLYPIILLNNVVQVPTSVQAFVEGGFGTLFGIGKDVYDGKIHVDLSAKEITYYEQPVSTTVSTPQGEIEFINEYLPASITMKNPLLEAKKKNITIDPSSPEYYLKKLQDDPVYQKALREKAADDAKKTAESAQKPTESAPKTAPEASVSTTQKSSVEQTPAQAPAKAKANQKVEGCGACFDAGLECACGSSACRCCTPGDSTCDAFDL